MTTIHTGVPQGTLVVKILIYINDFPIFSSNFNVIMYADDTQYNIKGFHPVTFELGINQSLEIRNIS